MTKQTCFFILHLMKDVSVAKVLFIIFIFSLDYIDYYLHTQEHFLSSQTFLVFINQFVVFLSKISLFFI